MASLNRWEGIGNLGKDPESRYLTSGDPVVNFSIACNESWKNKDGEKQEKCEWVSVVIFGKLAEIAGQYLKKGSLCYVAGRLQTRNWQDKEGADRWSTEVVVDKLVLLGGKRDEDGGERHTREENEQDNRPAKASTTPTRGPAPAAKFDDDVPF